MKDDTKNVLAEQDVIDAARDSKKEIRKEERAAIKELKSEYKDFKSKAKNEEDGFLPGDVGVAKEARAYAKEDIEMDARDGLDSIDDLLDEYLGDNRKSARGTIKEMKDVVNETTLDIDSDLYQ